MRTAPLLKRIFASFVFLLFTAFALQAQTKFFVAPGASTTATGNSWADPLDLQTAINTALAGDSVFVAQGTYQLANGQSYSMKEGVKIYGGFEGNEATLTERNLTAGFVSTLRGNNARVVYNNLNGLTAAALLDGFTITNGYGAYGAGMWNRTCSPTISNCVFAGNNGGGMYNSSSSAIVGKCVFTGNYGPLTTYGGGIGNANSPGVSIINCIFSGNQGHLGGGVYIDDIAPTSLRVINCTFVGNTASAGNGVGAIYCGARSSPKIQNCIIWGNSSAIYKSVVLIPAVITNNIIQGGHTGNSKLDPLFVNPSNPAGPDNIFGTADDGLLLQAGSPALNTGTFDTSGLRLPGTDISGAARIQGNKIDMGAYESSFSCSGFTTLYVDSSVVTSGDGSSWATAFKTFQEGLLAADQCKSASSLLVAKGTYQVAAGSEFGLLKDLKIYGGFPGGGGSFAQRNTATYTSILKGNGGSVFYNESIDATAWIDGFTITGGTGIGGGGMFNIYSSPSINNCVFTGNVVTTNGGGGGALFNRNGSPTITNCIFSNNSASTTDQGGGGAIMNSTASPVINHCFFLNNTAKFGGAIYNGSNPTAPVISNTVFAGNISGGDGAGIANYGTSLKLTNVTFVNNSAGRGGGAIDNYYPVLTITNTVFWGNTAVNGHTDIWLGADGSLDANYSFLQVARPGTGNILGSSSPFVNVANPAGIDGVWGTADDGIALIAGSPCINAGTPDTTGLALGDTDIAGNPRVVNTVIDLGSYEFASSTLPVTLVSFTGSLRNSVANLHWQTEQETNFDRFEVLKSTNGSQFQPLGQVPAKGTAGSYSYNTAQQEPTAYYRLKMVDLNGSAKYSSIIRLTQKGGNSLFAYPNPATNQLNIQVANAGSMNIYAADGKLVKTMTLRAGINTVEINELSAGIYYGVINGEQVRFMKK